MSLPQIGKDPDVRQGFVITMWCSPPLDRFDDDRAAQIARAGFNIAGPPCEGPGGKELTKRALATAERHGLFLWVADDDYAPHATEQGGWRSRLEAAVAAYRSHPALHAYFVVDEPGLGSLDRVTEVTEALAETDPRRGRYVNLLADYIPSTSILSTYAGYVEAFLAAAQPTWLSYDYYPFLVGDDGVEQDRPTFFSNLDVVRALSIAYDVPFMLIVQAMPHGRYRDPSEAELRWQVFHALAYGARGVSYFAYWTPRAVEGAEEWQFRRGLLEDGRPTRHYFEAARINARLRAMAAELQGYRSTAVVDSRGEVAAAPPFGPIDRIEGGEVTAGMFENERGERRVVAVNRDYRRAVRARIGSAPGAGTLDAFDSESGTWKALEESRITLAPGDACLLRWR